MILCSFSLRDSADFSVFEVHRASQAWTYLLLVDRFCLGIESLLLSQPYQFVAIIVHSCEYIGSQSCHISPSSTAYQASLGRIRSNLCTVGSSKATASSASLTPSSDAADADEDDTHRASTAEMICNARRRTILRGSRECRIYNGGGQRTLFRTADKQDRFDLAALALTA